MPLGTVWTLEEDQRLADLVQIHGPKRWSQIAAELGTKGSKQCRRRWKNFLSLDDRKQGSWTPEEDAQLLDGHKRHGNKWTLIAQEIGGRTDNAVKNRWAALEKKRRFGEELPEPSIYRQPRANDLLAVRRIIAKDQPRQRLPAAAEAPWMQEYQNELQQPTYAMNAGHYMQELQPDRGDLMPELLSNAPTAAEVPYNSQRSQANMEELRLQRQEVLAPAEAALTEELHGNEVPLQINREDDSLLSSSRQRAQNTIAALTEEPQAELHELYSIFNGHHMQQPVQLQQQQQLPPQHFVAGDRADTGIPQHQMLLPSSGPLIQQPHYQPILPTAVQQLPTLQPQLQPGCRLPQAQLLPPLQQQSAPMMYSSVQQQMPLCSGLQQAGTQKQLLLRPGPAADYCQTTAVVPGPGLIKQGSFTSSQEGFVLGYNRQHQQQEQPRYLPAGVGTAGSWPSYSSPVLTSQLQRNSQPHVGGAVMPAAAPGRMAEMPLHVAGYSHDRLLLQQQQQQQQQQARQQQQQQQQQQQHARQQQQMSALTSGGPSAPGAASAGDDQSKHWGPDELKQLLEVLNDRQQQAQQGRLQEEEVEQNDVRRAQAIAELQTASSGVLSSGIAAAAAAGQQQQQQQQQGYLGPSMSHG